MYILQFLASDNFKTNIWETIEDMKASVSCYVLEVLPVVFWFQRTLYSIWKNQMKSIIIKVPLALIRRHNFN